MGFKMMVDDLSKLDTNNWLISYIYVDDPSKLNNLKNTFDKEILKITAKINGWFFLCYTNLTGDSHLSPYHYKLFLWKKNEASFEDLEKFVRDTSNNLQILNNNSNPRFDQNYIKWDSKLDTYDGICDLYLGCISNKIRLMILEDFGKDLNENTMAFVLHFLFNQLLKEGYLYDLRVGAKLATNALMGLKIDPFIRKD